MKILVLIHEYPPVGGGGGRAAQDLCRGLAARGHEVVVLTAHLEGLPRDEIDRGMRVRRLASLRREVFRAGLPAMGGYVLAALWAGYGMIRRWHPDLIHAHFAVPAGAPAWALSRLTGVPYLMTVHLGDVPGGVPEKTGGWFKWIFPFTRPIWQEARGVVAVSEYTRGLALKKYTREIEVIPNGVELEKLQPGSIQVHDPPLILFAGRLVPQKDPLQIVRTLAGLTDLSWRCALIGDGPLLPKVRKEIEAQGLQSRFTLTGWVPPEEVLAWFDRGDILFMPSLSEGLPVVGVQALAKGLAIVASHIGGFVDLVEHGRNGYLVERGHPEGFNTALRELLSDTERLGKFRQVSQEFARPFDLQRIIARYETIFQETCRED